MTPKREAHLQRLKDGFVKHCDQKYRKGQRAHGGNLFEMDPLRLLDNALEENIDQFTYLMTLRDQLTKRG